jgi:hypothetical protein
MTQPVIKSELGFQCKKCLTGFETEKEAARCCLSCNQCGYMTHVGFERAQKCCPCSCGFCKGDFQ